MNRIELKLYGLLHIKNNEESAMNIKVNSFDDQIESKKFPSQQ